MTPPANKPEWAPRVSRYKIAQLYEKDAKGIRDDDLVDDVGISLLARVDSCLTATEAMSGRIRCPSCGDIIHRDMGRRRKGDPPEVLQCKTCHWQLPHSEYSKSYHKKNLGSPRLVEAFEEYAEQFPKARTYQEKMVLIDTLIHRYHGEIDGGGGGPGTPNLIGCTMSEAAEFLNRLTYSGQSTPGLMEKRDQWREMGKYWAYGPRDSE